LSIASILASAVVCFLGCGNSYCVHMNKSEALAVLYEIYDVCYESIGVSCFSPDPKSQGSKDPEGGY